MNYDFYVHGNLKNFDLTLELVNNAIIFKGLTLNKRKPSEKYSTLFVQGVF